MKYIILLLVTSFYGFAQPYFRSNEFRFEVNYKYIEGTPSLDVNHIDAKGPATMGLNSVDNRRAGIMDSVEWEYNEYNLKFYQPRYCVSDSLGVMISSPNRGVFAATENVPNPQVKFPITIGDSIYVEQPISNGKTMKGYLKVIGEIEYIEDLNNYNPWKVETRVVDGHLEINRKLDYNQGINNIYAWKIEARNLYNENYSAVYYYNEKNGFVYFNYKLANVEIEMNFDGRTERGFADENGVKYKDFE